MKATAWLKYFVYLLIIIGVMWLQGFASTKFQTSLSATYKVDYVLFSVMILLPILIGVVIGMDTFLSERAKVGRWKLNLPKLVFFIIPSLIVVSFYYFMVSSEKIYNSVIFPIIKFFGNADLFMVLFTVIFGYALMTIVYKSEDKKEVVAVGDDVYYEDNEIENNSNNITDREFVDETSNDVANDVEAVTDNGDATITDEEENR